MLHENLPVLPRTATMREAIVQIAERRGIAVVTDAERHILGVLTAGDLSRLLEREADPFSIAVESVMTRGPKVAERDELASAVVFRMEKHGIMAMPVVDPGQQLVGVVHLHDLMRARVV
jgi:arabinose-5-phosphate isomerase